MTVTSPPSSTDAALAREIVSGLIEACRDCEHVFELASHAVNDPMLRAELVQYCGQRREFVVELHDAIRMIGDDATDPAAAIANDNARWERLRQAAATDRAELLIECERHDLAALDAYRQAIAAQLPYALASLIHSQYLAIARVESRLQSLADAARGSSPIDNGRAKS